ncbi:MAG: hypothetical protein ABIO70_06090 [Pseudomonadota bacterium]
MLYACSMYYRDGWEGLEAAVVRMDREQIAGALALCATVRSGGLSLGACDGEGIDFVSAVPLYDVAKTQTAREWMFSSDGGWWPVEARFVDGLEPARLEQCLMMSDGREVWWRGVPKYGESRDYADTAGFAEADLRQMLEAS